MSDLRRLGWREHVALPALGIQRIRVKVDTGARSSSLHVDALEEYRDGDQDRVRFRLRTRRNLKPRQCDAAVLDRREVTDSGGHTSTRIFIATEIEIGGLRYLIEVNLAGRTRMMFPMLLGRTALAGRWMVDPACSFLLDSP